MLSSGRLMDHQFFRNERMAEQRKGRDEPAENLAASEEGTTVTGSNQLRLPPPQPARIPPLQLADGTERSLGNSSASRLAPPTIPGYEMLGDLGHGGLGGVY